MSEHDPKRNLHQRLHAVMGEVDYIQKEKKAGMQYRIVSHDAVTAAVRPVLVKHGVIYYPVHMDRSQDGNRTEITLTVRFANIDEPSDHIDVLTAGYGIDPQDKGPGKAISYAVKYALLKALGLETGDDPDQDQGARHEPRNTTPPRPQSATQRDGIREAKHAPEVRDLAAKPKPPTNGTPDPKAWAHGDDARDFLQRAKTDLGSIVDGAHLRQWREEFAWECQAIAEFASDKRNDFLNDLLANAQDRCRLPADGLRGAA